MALRVKARETLIKIGKYADTYRYVMLPIMIFKIARFGYYPGKMAAVPLRL